MVPEIGVALLCLSIVPITVGMLKLEDRVKPRSRGVPRMAP